jgi:hypothetical protein
MQIIEEALQSFPRKPPGGSPLFGGPEAIEKLPLTQARPFPWDCAFHFGSNVALILASLLHALLVYIFDYVFLRSESDPSK